MKKLFKIVVVLAIIGSLLLSTLIVAALLLSRSSWQTRIERAEKGNLTYQKLLAHSYATGNVFFQSGFLVGLDIEKARHWRSIVCATTHEEEYCRKL